ncbi:MAG: DUF72 domain-containing protein [Burkholderiales bacterium]|nr:DUF72 domain-containing protein [Burkholderiales bacterium]
MGDIDDLFGADHGGAPAGRRERAERPVGAPAHDPALAQLAARLPRAIRLGTSSWSFPGWAGLVYDRAASESLLSRRGLTAYARHPLLRAAGLDRGFYQPLAAAEYAAYAAQVPDDFRFVVKGPALVTDELRRDDQGRGTAPNAQFLDARLACESFVKPAVAGLGEKAGALVFQLSPLSRRTLADVPGFVARLHAFLWAVNQACAAYTRAPLLAVEVRNPELLTRALADALRDAGARYCLGVHARMPSAEEQLPLLRALWPGALVARWNLHAGFGYEEAKAGYAPFNRLVDEDPATRATLARVALATARAGQQVLIVANNKAEGSAPLTLTKLAQAIDALAAPAAPTS